MNIEILPITKAVLVITASYLIGSIPVGLIVCKIAGGIDIREHGSGNIGLTNVIRTLGWGPGLVTGVIDFLKGYLLVFLSMKMFSPGDFGGIYSIYEFIVIMVATIAMLGNLYPVYLLFRGGKGIATGLGVMSALLGVYIFIPLAVFGIFLFAFRFVSLASIVAAVAVPITVLLIGVKLPFIEADSNHGIGILSAFSWAAAFMIIWKHHENVKRIIAGKEPKIGKPKEPEISRKSAEETVEEKVEAVSVESVSNDEQ
ncbi:MAG: glycerol-3-phosphate 1-O-acyltransferase PlsY [bacterium]|nr:glycerol-3-phosphate 1-O-acyltransferase PlsY [bacterium]